MTEAWNRNASMGALKRAIPYIRLYRNRILVIKTGGAICEDAPALRSMAEQVQVLHELGIRVVVLHGGGPQITALSERLGLKATFVQGRRVTCEGTLETAIMAMNGSVNTTLLSACRAAQVPAVGLSGLDGGLVRATRRPPQSLDVDGRLTEIDYGHVGDIDSVDVAVLQRILDAGMIPVVSSLSADDAGRILNINADTFAARLAVEIGAEKLIFLTDTPGLLEDWDDPTTLVSYADIARVKTMRDAGAIAGGMLPKAQAAIESLEGGVGRVHLVGYRVPDGLLLEIFTNEGAGTLIVRDPSELVPEEQTESGKALSVEGAKG